MQRGFFQQSFRLRSVRIIVLLVFAGLLAWSKWAFGQDLEKEPEVFNGSSPQTEPISFPEYLSPVERFEVVDPALVPENEFLVEVEASPVITTTFGKGRHLVPYRYRRPTWGKTFSVSYSMYEPLDFTPNVVTDTFSNIYPTTTLPLIEVQFVFKRNMFLGSIGIEIAGGMYKTDSDKDLVDSTIQLIPVRLGATYVMDNLFMEPIVAPYISGGAYAIYYHESQDAVSFKGTTQAAPYASLGVLLQLDWLDKGAAFNSYMDAGLENTFFMVEARKFFRSLNDNDPDFESDIHANLGLRLEF